MEIRENVVEVSEKKVVGEKVGEGSNCGWRMEIDLKLLQGWEVQRAKNIGRENMEKLASESYCFTLDAKPYRGLCHG